MEPLSPRSVNIQFKAKAKAKDMVEDEVKKAELARKAAKEKEYAPPPPEWVVQPPMLGGVSSEKFKVGKPLGKGGFAICYEGELKSKRKSSSKSVFALKIVRAKMSQKKMEDKFRTELQIHAKMRHPNIVEFYRAFTFGESTYVVLELCSNGSVMDMVKKRKCLSLPEVRRFTIQLCGAIKYMHARNVIHRDLKMGNLFLDHEMNLKIGDFGLAAVLVSKEEVQGIFSDSAKMRRTTLCGTPNYIAPEILEKGKGGHDHKVDIWAIGVIVFAMLAGQPPFQASSQSEIYRRAKNVEYDWPQEGKHSNFIPEEAKDLVARLLKVDAAERPGPDEVIGHSFFSMHGSNAIPAIMEESFRYGIPGFLDLKAKPQGDVMIEGTQRLGLRDLAKHCGVGLLQGDINAQPAVGADTHLSLYTECLIEEQSGQAPIVPVPHNMVYASKFPSTIWPSLEISVNKEIADVAMPDIIDVGSIRKQRTKQANPERPRRAPVQSHAATLRASAVGSRAAQGGTGMERRSATSGITQVKDEPVPSVRRRRGLLDELPVRPTRVSPTPSDNQSSDVAKKTRTTRSKKMVVVDEEQEPVQKKEALLDIAKNDVIEKPHPVREQRHRDTAAARSRARIASNVVNEMARELPRDQKTVAPSATARSKSTTENLPPSNALIGPDEVLEFLPHSSPDEVLLQLLDLQRMLEASLTRKSDSKSQFSPEVIDNRSKNFKDRPVVVKWVDYTNKFGIGYILANGTVGCVFKGDDTSSPTCVVVANAESHFKRRSSPSYGDRHQIVPRHGPSIEFIENCGLEGLKRVLVPPSQYQVRVSASGTADRLGPGLDVFDFEKRKKLCLWEKFGKYMTQTLGKSDSDTDESAGTTSTSRARKAQSIAGPFVKFYQRLGNVGIWGFGDGSFQFNFPDHTKLVISDNGAWLDFYHLPIAAAQALRSGGLLEAGALAERSVLCYPTNVMLSGRYDGHEFGALIRDNELRKKVEFSKDVIAVWAKEGGLGVMGRKKGVKWGGLMEGGGKLVWVTVGAKGGDGRYEVDGLLKA